LTSKQFLRADAVFTGYHDVAAQQHIELGEILEVRNFDP
jgi:hypothetical protein